MGLLDETREDLGTTTVQVLAQDARTRRWEPTGAPVEVSVLELSGREKYELGKEDSVYVWRFYCDLDAGGNPPLSPKQRIRCDGKDFNLFGVRRVPGDDPGAIAEGEFVQ